MVYSVTEALHLKKAEKSLETKILTDAGMETHRLMRAFSEQGRPFGTLGSTHFI